ncbi:branched-chain amino acid ABC transporter permease [Glycomyces lechevalierae]|uniref:Branched-chain amino acid ABC transporter permease n=1 Tax=Glycomyces lechevalierae TaxID=256034 RepID=A0A9X3SU58_9ACTN|nr:branched-chain amino acid ABC transporter permease [Glycomyces lechevalierae]MDA1385200.1 branched-chain amino acid ABC transporter permease [Glycomyces lechevalierae]MDR7337184.1 branched-subunit amino acid ABC-type transport system permease component [Glycomyces lechevalierae]
MGAFLALGLFQGAVYGLLAVGIVLVYKAKRVFNFAQGEFGGVAAFTAYALVVGAGLPYWAGVVGGLAAAVAMGLIVERVIVRPLESSSRTIMLVALVGVALFTIAIIVLVGQPIPRVMPPLIEGGGVNILGAGILPQQLVLMAVLAVLAAAMAWFFKTDLPSSRPHRTPGPRRSSASARPPSPGSSGAWPPSSAASPGSSTPPSASSRPDS